MLALPTLLAFAPSAAACHTTNTGYWSRSDVLRQEVVGVGSNSVAAYVKSRDTSGACYGASYADTCTTWLGPVWTIPLNVPEVRVIGMVVVPASTVAPVLVLPSTAVPVGQGVACVPGPYDAGVGLKVTGVITADYGTDWLLP